MTYTNIAMIVIPLLILITLVVGTMGYIANVQGYELIDSLIVSNEIDATTFFETASI